MNVSDTSLVDFGAIRWPPGFRFHPNDDELVLYFLKRKICHLRIENNVIGELDVYKWDPEELPGQALLKTGDRQWFFFSHRDRRYPSGGRVNRATRHGYWKATGKDRNVTGNNRIVGVKKTLVFYKGRAPTGERTDWVMHEYTLHEDELKRCPTAQDSYALYKVFKKGGTGPRNGEQYGATFREEEWTDDDDPVDVVQPVNATPFVDSFIANDQGQQPESEVEEFLGQSVDDPIIDHPRIVSFFDVFPKDGGEEETLSTMVDPSIGEAISMEPRIVLQPDGQPSVAQASFDVTPSATSNMYSCDASEVTSTAPTISEQVPDAVGGDFLEINDLSDQELNVPERGNASDNMHPQEMNGWGGRGNASENLHFPELNGWDGRGNTSENLPIQEMNGWDGPDVYFDAEMFLKELGSIDPGMVPASYLDTLPCSQYNYQLSSDTDLDTELWTHEQRHCIIASAGSDQGVVAPPTSGFVYAGSSTNIHVETRQNQGGNEGEPQNSGISSKLWALLDSIPTTPASASESPLITRAFDRMSSFGRVRINPSSTGEGTPIVRTTVGSRGFSLLSFIGMMRPVFWVLVLSFAVKILSSFFRRFVPS